MSDWYDDHYDLFYEFDAPCPELVVTEEPVRLLGPDGEPISRRVSFGFQP